MQTEAVGLKGAPTRRILNPGWQGAERFRLRLSELLHLGIVHSKAVCLFTFLGFYVSPVVEARDVVSLKGLRP